MPGVRLGIVGGGQLGLMLGGAARPLGVETWFLDPSADAPARVVGHLLTAAYDDAAALDRLAATCDAATYEFENVPASAAERLAGHVPTAPSSRSLEVAQDRLAEKELFVELGIPTAAFAVAEATSLHEAVSAVGLPVVVKRRRGGYDGKGQAVARSPDDVERAARDLGDAPLLVERHIDFVREVSILVVRARDGSTDTYDTVENEHEGGVLRTSVVGVSVDDATRRAAAEVGRRVAEHLGHVGVLAVELFDTGSGLLANELAPRVHNSGHWTIEGAETSQFENHVRAVLGWPLGTTGRLGPTAMVNCLGATPPPPAVLGIPGAHLHVYGKAARPRRKVGHVTVTAPDAEVLAGRLAEVRTIVTDAERSDAAATA